MAVTASLTIESAVPLAPLTTLGLGGPAQQVVVAHDDDTVLAALAWAKDRGFAIFVLGGGSNIVFPDAGVAGLVLRIATRGRNLVPATGAEVHLEVAAGEPWDAIVSATVAQNLAGLECLAGIPGLVGATPIQNVGAYGQEVADTIRAVRVVDRRTHAIRELSPNECRFGYRDSVFKHERDRYVVLGVRFALRSAGAPTVRYAELEAALASRPRPPSLSDIASTVRDLRRKKSMVLDPNDPNRRSVGSFFMNPVLSGDEADRVVARAAAAAGVIGVDGARPMPMYATADGRVKLSAAWLIEHAGFAKGFRRGHVGISSRHALALVHHGDGTTAELLSLARDIQAAVLAKFGVALVPEPVIV